MFPLVDMMQCQDIAVPADVMHHVVQVESSFNPYAIGVVGGKLVRQPRTLAEAVSTAQMLEDRGYNFSVGLAQVNRYNLSKYGVTSYAQAFDRCTNLQAGSRILSECHERAKGDWGSAFSCYYSGNFVTGFQHGYVKKIFASMGQASPMRERAIPVADASRASAFVDVPVRRTSALPEPQDTGEALSRDPLWAGGQSPSLQSAIAAHGPNVALAPVESSSAPSRNASDRQPELGGAKNEGVVRLTRSGPIFPAQTVAAPVNEVKPNAGVAEAQQVLPGDTAFVF